LQGPVSELKYIGKENKIQHRKCTISHSEGIPEMIFITIINCPKDQNTKVLAQQLLSSAGSEVLDSHLEADSSVRCKNSHIEEENGMHS
jgi:hypothetical protein